MLAALFADLDGVARRLVERGAALDRLSRFRDSALVYACRSGSAATARLLVERGAALNSVAENGKTGACVVAALRGGGAQP